MLEIVNLTKRFGDYIALDGVNLTLGKGVFGLLGPNGAGKTTLMRALVGLIELDEGEIRFNGVERDEFLSSVGYLPQSSGFYPEFTAEEFLAFMMSLKGIKVVKAELVGLLEQVNLAGESKRICAFSGGMKRRLGIAQALIGDPNILILDEPTAGLDLKERIRFRNLISDLGKDKTIIFATHIISDISMISKQLIMMDRGRVIAKGTKEELIANILNRKPELQFADITLEDACVNYFEESVWV